MKFFFFLSFIIFSFNMFGQKSIFELYSGKEIRVRIYDEDSTKYYVYISNQGVKADSYIAKDSVKNIKPVQIGTSPFDVSFGFGSSHGCLGTKVLVGKDNSGFFAGIGRAPKGLISPSFGLQGSIGTFFGNIGYGSRGVYKINDEPYKLDMDLFYNIGFLIRIGDYKQYFIEVAFGGIGANKNFNPGYRNFEYFHYNGTLAFGFNL